MATTTDQKRQWLADARTRGATHLLVVHNSMTDQTYPMYVYPGVDPRKHVLHEYGDEGSLRVIEVFWLGGDIEEQLQQVSCFNYGPDCSCGEFPDATSHQEQQPQCKDWPNCVAP